MVNFDEKTVIYFYEVGLSSSVYISILAIFLKVLTARVRIWRLFSSYWNTSMTFKGCPQKIICDSLVET